jgi:acetylornithine deacetylase/succinyl-diaminopimelate desuccinylase-like protein
MNGSELLAVSTWIDENQGETLDELLEVLRIPSISTDSRHADDVRRCADRLSSICTDIGFKTTIHDTARHPIVVAEWRDAGERAPTLLIYAHYDVQPPEPLEEWVTPPFEPAIRDGKLFARGAADDKGQLWIHLNALRAHLSLRRRLPVNVVLLIEGEEEVGSKSLSTFLYEMRDLLACDYLLVSDTPMLAAGIPSVLCSMRGIAYFEIHVRGAQSDLHSGQYGGVVANPATALGRIISTLHDGNERIAIQGFYDSVRDPTHERRESIRALEFDEGSFAKNAGVARLTGEAGYSPLERIWLRPTCEVNGIKSGYTGEGAKTVLPGDAMMKLSFRLVPDQTPDEVERLLREHISCVTPTGVSVGIRRLHSGMPWLSHIQSRVLAAVRRALACAFENEAVTGGTGGSIPIVVEMAQALDAECLIIGFGLPAENAHAPNEWLDLDNYRRGTIAMAALYDELALL